MPRSSSSTTLSGVPIEKRKQFAATLGLFSVLFVAVGAVAATGPGTAVIRVFVAVALVVAVLLALMAWGVVHSIKDDTATAYSVEAERDMDALIDEALAASPRKYGSLCNCGHDHDPTELHFTDEDGLRSDAGPAADGCDHDATGVECRHDCADCVLASLRPSPNQTRSERLSS